MSNPTLLPHATALLDVLASTGFPIGDHVAPRSPDGVTFVAPAAVLYLRPGGQVGGSVGRPDEDGVLVFQVTAIGATATSALVVADAVAEALEAGGPLDVDGRYVPRVHRQTFGTAAQRDDDVTPPLFYMPVIFRAMTNAADPVGS